MPRTSVRPVGDVVALEADATGRDLVVGVAEQGVGQGGLARAVGAHQRVHLGPARRPGRRPSGSRPALDGQHVQVVDLEEGSRAARGRHQTWVSLLALCG